MSVTLRKRAISNGRRYSLYVDTYKPGIGTISKSLGIYIPAQVSGKIEKQHVKDMLAIGEGIRKRKETELLKPEIYTPYELERIKRQEKGNTCFISFCRERVLRKTSGQRVYETALTYFQKFLKSDTLKCSDITLLLLDEFRDWIPHAEKLRRQGTISRNSAATYFAAFKGLLTDAYKSGLLIENVSAMVDILPSEESHDRTPTAAEISRLVDTECNYPLLKEAALFSALTGMRFSDIQKLQRSEIKRSPLGPYLHFNQQKGGAGTIQQISEEAFNIIPPLGEKPFGDLDYFRMQRPFKKWISDAGIDKPVTFHWFRHFYATTLLANGVDLYTVSKMLGHKSIQSTQVYAKVMDEAKRRAADMVRLQP